MHTNIRTHESGRPPCLRMSVVKFMMIKNKPKTGQLQKADRIEKTSSCTHANR